MALAIDTIEMITTTIEQTTTEEAIIMAERILLGLLPIKTPMPAGIRNHKPLKTM
jgi:hypothetical protein